MDKKAPVEGSSAGDLDPEDWSAFEDTAKVLLDAAIEKYRHASEGPVWRPTPDDLKSRLKAPLPEEGMDPAAVADRLKDLMPYGVGNTHPRFFGWVHGSGSPGNLLAEIVAAAMNANCGGRDHAAIYVERQVIAWCRQMLGFPETSSGLIVSGTSMATMIAAKTARDAALDFDSRVNGLNGARLTGYVSEQAHSCLDRAFDMLGLGSGALRKVAVDDAFRVDLDDLAEKVADDRRNGFTPFLVAGTAGTVNTGAIDDLVALSAFAKQERLWFHVDGAFGACAITSERVRPQLKGMEAADSLAFDFHKWMHVNYDAGCVLIRSESLHRKAFANRPDYLAADGKALAGGDPWPVDYGPELSRGFRALKVWAHLQEHGLAKIGASITRNCEQAAYLAGKVDAHPQLERVAPVALNICCFRVVLPAHTDAELDDLNAQIVARLQTEGIAAPSTTRINGRLVIRVNITNHRTRTRDLDILIEAIETIANLPGKSSGTPDRP